MKKKNLKLDKKILLPTLALFLAFGLSLNVNAAYRCGTLNQNESVKSTPYVSNYGYDKDFYEYLTGAGELNNKPVVCVTPTKTYSHYQASCEDSDVNLYQCRQGKQSGRCGYAYAMQLYAMSSKSNSDYFKTMYRARYFKMTANEPNMSIWYMRGWTNRPAVYKNTYNGSGTYRFTSGNALSIASEYKKAINGDWHNYGKKVWYSKAEKWTVNGGKFNKIAKGGYATVTIDTKKALDFTSKKYSSFVKNPIVLGGTFKNYFNVKEIKGNGDKITFKLVIKDDKYVDAISKEIETNKNISNKLTVKVKFKDKRDIKAVVDVRPTDKQSLSQVYKSYKEKPMNSSCGGDSEAKNVCPGIATGGNPTKSCTQKKNACDYSKNPNSPACTQYSKDCCDDLVKACEKDLKSGKTKDQSENCKAVDTYACVQTTDNCNDLDAAKAGKVVKDPKSGNNTFNHDVWEWLDKNGTEQQKNAYKQYCPCNCDSSAADISSGACNLTGGGKYDEDKYNQITNEDKKKEYINACSPCDFDDDNAVTCSAAGSCDESETSIGKVAANYEENKLIACANAEGVGSTKNYNQDIFGDKTPAVCYETYDIYYKEAKISSGINTALGVSRYLKFQANTDKLLDNTIRIEAKKTCYVKGALNDIQNKASSKSSQYSDAPTLKFTYDENIANEGFYYYEAKNANTTVDKTTDGNIQKVIATKSYTYEPATKYSVGVIDGKFYYTKHKDDSELKQDKLLTERPTTGDENIKYIGDTKNTDDSKGRVFPIKFTTPAQEIVYKDSEKKVIDYDKLGYKYTINVKKYNINDKSINKDLTEVSDKNTKCTNKYSCKYVISKKTCKEKPCTCDYVCMKDVGKSEKATSPYCSEVCYEEGTTKKTNSALSFAYTTVSTDKFLDSKTATAIGENWLDEKAQETIREIEDTSKKGETFKVPILEVEINSSNREEIINAIENSKYLISKNENCQNKIKSSDITYCVSEFLRNYLTDEQIKKLDNSYDIYTYSSGKETAWK